MPPTTPKPASGHCKLNAAGDILSIQRSKLREYQVERINIESSIAKQAIRLTRLVDGVPSTDPDVQYEVWENEHGFNCTCNDFIYRRESYDEGGCKHIKAAKVTGLLT